MPQTLKKFERITRRVELGRVFRQGKVASDDSLSLRMLANGLGRSRLGVTVSSRHGGAVRRNRIKRLCREAFRTCRDELPAGYDYVLGPRVGADLTVEGIRHSLRALARRAIKDPQP